MRTPFTDPNKEKAAEPFGWAANSDEIAARECQHSKKLPAYGRALLDAQRRGYSVPWLVLGLGWKIAGSFPRLVIPADTIAAELDLRMVRGLSCMVAHYGETSRALDVAEAALMAGATCCPILDLNARRITGTDEVMAARGLRAAA